MILAPLLLGFGFAHSALSDFIRVQPTPQDFVLRQFARADVVFLGEDHGVKDHLDFVADIVPKLDAAGIHLLGVEFGAEEDQATVDRLVTQPIYDPVVARELQFNYNVGWAIQEYQSLYRAAWQLNQRKRPGETPFRIVHLSYRYNWSKFTGRHASSMKGVFYRGPIESFRANIIERESLLPSKKMLVLVGTPHAYTRYSPMKFDALAPNYLQVVTGWLGQLVEQKAPGRTRTIMFNQPFYGLAPNYKPSLLAEGRLENAWAEAGSRPVGIDLDDGPAGELVDSTALPMGESSDRGGIRLRDWADGILVLKRLRDLRGGSIDSQFVTEEKMDAVRANWPDPDWAPAPKTLAEYYEKVSRNLDLARRYSGL